MKQSIKKAGLVWACLLVAAVSAIAKEKPLSDRAVVDAMKKATVFMVEKVSNNGGYLWNYSPDFSRVWGELECKPSIMWIERGTPAMGNIFITALCKRLHNRRSIPQGRFTTRFIGRA